MDVYAKYIEAQIRQVNKPPAHPGHNECKTVTDSYGEKSGFLVKNGRVLLPEGLRKMDIVFTGGKVSSLHERAEGTYEKETDAAGLIVSPGIIDPHVHLGFAAPFEHELRSETRSAIAGGLTTLGCMLGDHRPHSETFPKVRQQVGEISWTDIVPHLIIHNVEQKREIPQYVTEFGVRSFKLFVSGLPGYIPSATDGLIFEVMREVACQGSSNRVCIHAENYELMEIARAKRGEQSAFFSSLAEEEAIQRVCLYAERTLQPIYIVHVSSELGARRVKELKQSNAFMIAETTSPYLCAPMERDTSRLTVMSPPMHGGSSRDALWAGIRDGSIETVGTDNVTLTLEEKRANSADVNQIMPGYPALETHLPSMLSEGIKRGLSVETILKTMTEGPAKAFGIYPQKGALTPGCDADATLIDLNTEKTVKAALLHSRSDFSLYENQSLRGWPSAVIKNGSLVYENGTFFDRPDSKMIFR